MDRFHERRDSDGDQPEEETAVQVCPRHHDERQPVDRARPSAQVPVEPQQLEAGEGEGDHLRTRTPDRGTCETGDPHKDRGDDRVGHLELDAPPDQRQPDERQGAERERHERQAADLVHEVGKDLGGVLRVDPLLARDGEREDVLRDELVVVDHPLPRHEVPEDVGIAASAHDHAQDHDEGRDNDELTWCDASESAGDGGGHQAEGYPVPGLGGHRARDGHRLGVTKVRAAVHT